MGNKLYSIDLADIFGIKFIVTFTNNVISKWNIE